jgi:hypothetical protein
LVSKLNLPSKRFIEKNNSGNYSIRIRKDNKRLYLGSYPTLFIAQNIRDIYVGNDYQIPQDSIIEYNGYYWVIEDKNGKIKYKGHYKDKQQAKDKLNELDTHNIIKYNNGNYIIQKSIKNKNENFGSYKTLSEAIKIRNLLEEHQWSRTYFNEILYHTESYKNRNIYYDNIKRKYKVLKIFNNIQKTFGTYDTLSEARKERDRLNKNGWVREEDEMNYIQKWGAHEYKIVRSTPTKPPKREIYGTYLTLEEAMIARDRIVEKGFPKECITGTYEDLRYINISKNKNNTYTYSVRKQNKEERIYYGASKNLEYAIALRNVLELNDWSIFESDVFQLNDKFVVIIVKPNGNYSCLGICDEELDAVNKLNEYLVKHS